MDYRDDDEQIRFGKIEDESENRRYLRVILLLMHLFYLCLHHLFLFSSFD